MKADKIKRLETLWERKLSLEEKERLRKIGRIMGIGDNEALWDVVSALEYQRAYYEELPQKITAASAELLQGLSEAAEKEVSLAQGRLAESVVEQAKKLSVRNNVETLLPLGVLALASLIIYGSIMIWAGFCLGTGQAHTVAAILLMPSGLVLSGMCFAGGIFLGVYAGREFAVEGKGWRKTSLVALAMVIAGGVAINLVV